MSKFPNLFVSFSLTLATVFSAIPTQNTQASGCSDVEVIFVRGSGSPANKSADYLAFKSALTSELDSQNSTVIYHFYDLGSSPHGGHQYPAISIEDSSVLLGAFIGSGQAFSFGESIKGGIAELSSYVDEISSSCPYTKFVLAGYSQGAMVVSRAIQNLNPEKILYAATFGDPKLYLPEGKPDGPLGKPLACSGRNLSNYRINVPDCEVESGILGSLNPYQLAPYTDKLGTWCNEADFMCGSYFDFGNNPDSTPSNPLLNALRSHLSYLSDGSYAEASKLIVNAIAKSFPAKANPTHTPTVHQDIAILIDVTDSMSSLIDQYRQEALNLTEHVKESGGNVSIYTYGDELRENTKPQLLCDSSCSIDQIRQKLAELTIEGGDDTPESALSALIHVMDTMTWHKKANKSIVLLTDSSYHSTDVRGITLSDVVRRSYEIDPVSIFAITPERNAPSYLSLTSQTGGQVFNSDTEIPSSTAIITERPYSNIGEVTFSDTPKAHILNHSLTYADASASISLSSYSSTAYYLVLDEAPLGLSLDTKFTITDLHDRHLLSIIPINSDGRPGTPYQIELVISTQTSTKFDEVDSTKNTITISKVKAPNCGTQ